MIDESLAKTGTKMPCPTSLPDLILKWIGVATTIGVPIGGYYRFLKRRDYSLRLEPTVTGKLMVGNGEKYLEITTCLKNVGASKAEISSQKSYIRILSTKGVKVSNGALTVPFDKIDTIPAFPEESRIESGETITSVQFLGIADEQYFRFRIDMKVVSKGVFGLGAREWKGRVFVDCASAVNQENSVQEN